MSLFGTLNTGASGLGVASTYLSVVGDNIANINTTGYKQSRASFADMMPQEFFGMAGRGQLGIGAATNAVTSLFGQGSLESTGSALDMAIGGDGFFVVNGGDGDYYTRAGQFGVDSDGFVTNASGLRLQGYSGTAGSLSATVGDIQIPSAALPGEATSAITVNATLSPDTEIGTDLAALDFYGTGTGTSTIADAGAAADFSTSVTMYDSLGVGHEVSVLFERSGANEWSWRAIGDASEVYDSSGAAMSSESGSAFEMASGTVSFDTNGAISGFTQTDTSATWSYAGSAQPSVAFDFGMDASGDTTDGSISMTGEESSVTSITQDGNGAGSLTGVDIESDGTISGKYSNGENVVLGQVAIASFKAPQGLDRVGGSLFSSSRASGQPALGAAGTGGRGELHGATLERSNVELEDQFVQMITAQRSYQANSKVISTANETLQALMQMI